MRRIRIKTPRGKAVEYTNMDLIKDAATNMLVAAGGDRDKLIGEGSHLWGAAPICFRAARPRDGVGSPRRAASEIVVFTPDPVVAALLDRADPREMRKIQPVTRERIDMEGSSVCVEEDPVVPGMTEFLEAYALTPILASRTEGRQNGRWHSSVRDFDISATVSARLSKVAGRPVRLQVIPDELYLAGRGTYATRVDIRTHNNRPVVLVGMLFPFLIAGSAEDLSLAWHAGIGERNRLGFGCFAAT